MGKGSLCGGFFHGQQLGSGELEGKGRLGVGRRGVGEKAGQQGGGGDGRAALEKPKRRCDGFQIPIRRRL